MKLDNCRLASATWLALAILLMLVLCGAAQAQTFTVLHYFTGQGDGGDPLGTPTMDASGNLYGTTYYNGSTGWGTAYKLGLVDQGWVLTPLYTFGAGGQTDGQNPYGNLVFDHGILYGAAWEGGADNFGTVYSLRPSPHAFPVSVFTPMWPTWMHSFTYWDGQYPFFGDLTMDSQGNLYGTTEDGGSYGQGTVYEMTHSAGGWTFQTLYNFAPGGTVGAFPMSGVTVDAAGNIYGTTTKGGTTNSGVVYQVTPSGVGSVLYNFTGGDDGAFPMAGVILDAATGNLYGATSAGGTAGGGAVFQLSPGEGGWTYSLIYPITGWGYQSLLGTGIWRNLVRDPQGNLYGVTSPIQTGYYSSVFKLTPGVGGWGYTTLYTFTNGADGSISEAGLVRDAQGNLYGVALGGNYNYGLVFKITPGGR